MKPAHTRQIVKHLKAIGDIILADIAEAEVVVPPPVAIEPAPVVEPVPLPPVIIATQKRQLTGDRLVWDRTIKLPNEPGLQYACGGFGVRMDPWGTGHRHMIMIGNKNQGDAFIIDLDAAGPESALVGIIRDYHNGPTGMHVGDSIGDAAVEPTGATYDQTDRLIYTFADPYNVTQRDDYSWGFNYLPSGSVAGPFRARPGSHRTSGYPVLMPDGSIYFGAGLTSGNAGSSWGPSLFDSTTGTPIIDYSFTNRCRRNADYRIDNDPTTPDRAADSNGGFWTQNDFINGGCAIDLPDVSGLLFCGHQGRGLSWYGGKDDHASEGIHDSIDWKGPHAERRMPLFWIVNLENPNPLQVEEVDLPMIQVGQFPVLSGSWCDTAKRELFVCAPNADYSRGLNGSLGLIHVWRIK